MTMAPAQANLGEDGRLRLRHGPIELIIEAFGAPGARTRALEAAARRFATILDELVAELPILRRQCPAEAGPPEAGSDGLGLIGPVARRMADAVLPLASYQFITPMAAVAGAVADEIAESMAPHGCDKFYVNNGGDIAFGLTPGTDLIAAMVAVPSAMVTLPNRMHAAGTVTLTAAGPARGLATSGRHGRSFSFGIADAVTVLAPNAAMADAAATLIANRVDLPGHRAIRRQPANQLDPDSDLGARAVTVDVGALTKAERDQALARGLILAQQFHRAGHITGAALMLDGDMRLCGALPELELTPQDAMKEAVNA